MCIVMKPNIGRPMAGLKPSDEWLMQTWLELLHNQERERRASREFRLREWRSHGGPTTLEASDGSGAGEKDDQGKETKPKKDQEEEESAAESVAEQVQDLLWYHIKLKPKVMCTVMKPNIGRPMAGLKPSDEWLMQTWLELLHNQERERRASREFRLREWRSHGGPAALEASDGSGAGEKDDQEKETICVRTMEKSAVYLDKCCPVMECKQSSEARYLALSQQS
ncbi:uncharacterized protein HKW66_Vig0067290 [Vigna angularis]|uniref:Uncharacterized protein n=1 Tax=Phaseolus angularis TaxID=3914 RepID=A0A8T0KCE7_PHAAN|nr:uncharacterized protein HKW66_Vig0067290 [Vigna angularis]